MNQDQCMAKKYAGAYWDHTDPTRMYDKFGFTEVLGTDEQVAL